MNPFKHTFSKNPFLQYVVLAMEDFFMKKSKKNRVSSSNSQVG